MRNRDIFELELDRDDNESGPWLKGVLTGPTTGSRSPQGHAIPSRPLRHGCVGEKSYQEGCSWHYVFAFCNVIGQTDSPIDMNLKFSASTPK